MKIEKLVIRNFRSLKDVEIEPGNILGLVGRNNSGKSNVLQALRLFFESSVSLLSDECFYNYDTDNPIEIFVTFNGLSDWERERFGPWMDGEKLIIGRRISFLTPGKYSINTVAFLRVPEVEWLQQDKINSKKIDEWWPTKSELKIGDYDFSSVLSDRKPNVSEWKSAADIFLESHMDHVPHQVVERENPRGYPNILKGALPELIYVPAVRDVTDETKVAKTNPYGQLINTMLEQITDIQKNELTEKLHELQSVLNRGSDERFVEIQRIEGRLNELIGELIDCDIEIEMSYPELDEVFRGAKIYADDGIRTTIESKGHGLQRSMIFTILRAYAELSHNIKAGDKAAERTTIFTIEEPELYLHPQFQRTLMSVFKNIAGGRDQVFYSTQSSLFVDIEFFDDICIMRREGSSRDKSSQPTQLTIKALVDDLYNRKGVEATNQGIRELYAHAFSPIVNEGFFAEKNIIVEGPSEVYSLPEYSGALGLNLDYNNISVIPADGKGPIDRLLRVFTGFGIPTYVVFDGDKSNDDNNVKAKTLEILSLLGTDLDSIEDVKTDTTEYYTIFEETYDQTLQHEIDDYHELATKASEVLGPIGKPLRNKFIAKTIRNRIENGTHDIGSVPPTLRLLFENVERLERPASILGI